MPEIAAPEGGSEGAKGEGSEGSSPTYVDSLTPSGIEVRYHWAPKRKYELRKWIDRKTAKQRLPGPEWVEVPSVTHILDVLHKPLTYWAMKVGVEGIVRLIKEHNERLVPTELEPFSVEDIQKSLVEMLVEKKLTVNHVRDKAGDRGLVVHDAFETWAKTGIIPDPSMYSEEESGYVAGLAKFLRDIEPEPQAAEVMVGSLEHGYAGRYDARLYVPLKCEVVYKHTPKRGDHRAVLAPGHLLVDLKTSSGVYPSHELQLAGYEAASIECGYGPSDGRGIIHVLPDGNYEFFRARALPEDFFAVLSAYRAIEKFKKKDR